MKKRRSFCLLLLLPLLIAAGGAAAQDKPLRGMPTSGGSFYVTYEPDPDPIPLNEMFSLKIRVTRADDHGKLVEGAAITAEAFMPEHQHGTTLQPKIDSLGDGTAVGRGFLLHMEGLWHLRIGVAVAGQMERVTFEIRLEP